MVISRLCLLICGLVMVICLTSVSRADFEQSTYQITRKLKCPVCNGQSVADSTSDIAISMQNYVKSLLQAGKDENEIIMIMRQQYGDSVIYQPIKSSYLWAISIPFIIAWLILVARFIIKNNYFGK